MESKDLLEPSDFELRCRNEITVEEYLRRLVRRAQIDPTDDNSPADDDRPDG